MVRIFMLDLSKISDHDGGSESNRSSNLKSQIAKQLVLDFYQRKNNELIKNKYGKPYFYGQAHQHFSISHSKNMLAVAFDNKEIGLDVEVIQEDQFQRLIDFFNQSAIDFICDGKGMNQFLKCWVMKEAVIKKFGLSLFEHGRSIYLLEENHEWRGKFNSYEVACGYIEVDQVMIGWAKDDRVSPHVEYLKPDFIRNKLDKR